MQDIWLKNCLNIDLGHLVSCDKEALIVVDLIYLQLISYL